MQTVILLIVLSLLGALAIKCAKHEDALIELEDKIMEDIREFFKERKAEKAQIKKISSVKKKDAFSNRAA